MNNIRKFQSLSVMTWAWFVLVVMTVLAWWFGTSSGNDARLIIGVIITAAIKIWVIGYQFMELHRAPPFLNYVFLMWVLSISTILLTVLYVI